LALVIWGPLDAGSDSANVFRQARHGFTAAGFILYAVDTHQAARARSATAEFCGQAGNRIESYGRKRFALMRQNNFDAVGEAGKSDFQMGMLSGQVVECFPAGGYNRNLQLSNGLVLQPGKIGQIMRRASDRGSQPRISVDLQMKALGFSDHGC
jgi:hypothetical protein